MKSSPIIVSLSIILVSCGQPNDIHFKSSDIATGGFTEIQFDLNRDKTLNLLKIEQKATDQNEAGTVYVPETLSVIGKWRVCENNFCCEMEDPEAFITEAFFTHLPKTKDIFQNNGELSFPITTDTLYIYGYPCVPIRTK